MSVATDGLFSNLDIGSSFMLPIPARDLDHQLAALKNVESECASQGERLRRTFKASRRPIGIHVRRIA